MAYAGYRYLATLLLVGCVAVSTIAPTQSGGRPLTFQDLMKFRRITDAVISEDGAWIAYSLVPDRGDGEAVFRSVASETELHVERGSAPHVSGDSRWGVAKIQPTFEEREQAKHKRGKQGKDEKDKDAPKPGLSIVALEIGEEERIEKVEDFALSKDGRWLAYRHHREEEEESESEEVPPEEEGAEEEDEEGEKDDVKELELGSILHLRDLATGDELVREHVLHFAFDETSKSLVFDASAPEGAGNGLFAFDLTAPEPEVVSLHAAELGVYSHLTWARERSRLAFVAATFDLEHGEAEDAEVWLWDGTGEANRLADGTDAPEGFDIPAKNELTFSRDGERLFFGFKPIDPDDSTDEDESGSADGEAGEEEPFDPYDIDAILEKRGVDVWHWQDPWIIPNQKKRWEKKEKDRVYLAVVHLDRGKIVPLADLDMPDLEPSDNPVAAIGTSDVPYRREVTWDGNYADLYVVELETGERQRVIARLSSRSSGRARISPSGRFVSFYRDDAWHLYDRRARALVNATRELGVAFANEDHDYPSDPPGYGQAEWLSDDSAVLIYDKYDVWQVYTDGRPPLRLTSGRESEVVHRVIDRDPETDHLEPGSELLFRAYHDREKHDAFVAGQLGRSGVRTLIGTGEHRLRFVAQAEHADQVLFTRERYDEFPDLRVTTFEEAPVRLSDACPQVAEFAWGAAELVEWRSLDGIPLQGVLIKPGNYEAGRRYPVLVYFYRFFSQRLHEFNHPVVSHRPSLPLYASNGYAVFLPDIRFKVGTPGFSATKCLVPGLQKLVDMGLADADALGLHGHSWSGYQTAFVITQTDIFKAAVAGAPVSNMTSAYSGIRLETGLARQFQYEKSQSRIGGSLWENLEGYIENSPVFFADRIDTPLLIQFGDEDGAVPWEQGIELYLACRRLDKECVFLQYRGEPHGLKQYANKLDYAIKMREFFDHHLKGAAAPEWMTEGVPYRGE